MFGYEIVHVVVLTGGAHLIMAVLKRDDQWRYVAAWVSIYISWQHYDAYINRFMVYDMGVGGCFTMMQVLKLYALACNYADGGTNPALLSDYQKDKMAVQLPSILEMYSYTWYCNTAALGVFFEYADYKRFIEKTHEYKDVPSPVLPSLKLFAQVALFLTIFVIGNAHYPLETCWSEKYLEFSFPYRVFYYCTAFSIKRTFYYAPFLSTTAAIVASGLGYNGPTKSTDGKVSHKWDKIIGVYWVENELLTSPVLAFRYWNY